MNAPLFTELNATTAATYADWLAASFNTTVAGEGRKTDMDGVECFDFALTDGSAATVWLENGKVYGEA
jgi:hypothetical protein